MVQLILVILSMLMIASYTTALCVKGKCVPNSISATFYKLEHKLWFLATMWLTAGFLIYPMVEINPDMAGFAFLAVFGMILVGAAPNFEETYEGKIHAAGAVACIVGSQIWVASVFPEALYAWILCAVYFGVDMLDSEGKFGERFMACKPMFWIEIVALLTTYTSCLKSFL